MTNFNAVDLVSVILKEVINSISSDAQCITINMPFKISHKFEIKTSLNPDRPHLYVIEATCTFTCTVVVRKLEVWDRQSFKTTTH